MAMISSKEFWREFEGTYANSAEFESAIIQHFTNRMPKLPPETYLTQLLKTAHDRGWIKKEEDGSFTVDTDPASTIPAESVGEEHALESIKSRDKFMSGYVRVYAGTALHDYGVNLTATQLSEAIKLGFERGAEEWKRAMVMSGRSEIPIETEGK